MRSSLQRGTKKHIHTHGGVQKNKISNRLITEKTELSHFFAALRYFFYSEGKSIIENFIHWDEKHLKRFAISRCWRWKKNVFNAALLLRVPAPPYEPAGVYIDHFSCSSIELLYFHLMVNTSSRLKSTGSCRVSIFILLISCSLTWI